MQYPHKLIYPVDYGIILNGTQLNAQSFDDPGTQEILLTEMKDAIAGAASSGMAARTVDVVAHSMGGLVTRYLMTQFFNNGGAPLPLYAPDLFPNPVHQLITIGTPHLGTQLATALVKNQYLPTWVGVLVIPTEPILSLLCLPVPNLCTLGGVMSALGKPVDTGVQSMEPNSSQIEALLPTNEFATIVGEAPTSPPSVTEDLLDTLIGAFLPLQSVASILNQLNDTVVPINSQNPPRGPTDSATVSGIVHASFCLLGQCSDTDEPHSQSVWAQAYYWLTGGIGIAPSAGITSGRAPRPLSTATSAAPVLNLSGYTQVAASNVAFLPAAGSILTINSAANITVSSSAKTITEVLLLQTVTDPTDTPLLYATQSPFTIPFTPTRLGSASFGAIAVFSDNTYAMTTLNYTFQPSGTPSALNLLNAPLASMNVGDSRVVQANALFPSGPINVTQVATYTAQSGSTNVFSVSAGGTITANGNGVDLLNVSYEGVTATVPIPVGACTYTLNPTNQIVASAGGTVTVEVTTQSGCTWTVAGGAAWLTFKQASGSGNGAVTLTAAANSSGGIQAAAVTLAGLTAVITQPATACSYSLTQTQITAPAAGASGAIGATTSCPVTASSSQSWLAAAPVGSSVQYTIAPNNGTSQRTATLTVGSVAVPVTQAALNPCDLKQNGNLSVADVQLIANQALGVIPFADDLNGDGVVNIVDVQLEINVVLGLGCFSQ